MSTEATSTHDPMCPKGKEPGIFEKLENVGSLVQKLGLYGQVAEQVVHGETENLEKNIFKIMEMTNLWKFDFRNY